MLILENLKKKFSLALINEKGDLKREIKAAEINRPGLALAGFFDYFDQNRIQLLGLSEISYLESLPLEICRERFLNFLSLEFPGAIITRGLTLPPFCLELVTNTTIPFFVTPQKTTWFAGRLGDYLEEKLAPKKVIHGVMVDVSGVGVLITGESGIGKSEVALELIKRGHRLVADDAVLLTRLGDSLIAEAPEKIRNLLEIRGLGIMDVKHLYGVEALKLKQTVNLNLHLLTWEQYRELPRIPDPEDGVWYLDVKVPRITIPVKPGRNLAGIVEAAALNFRVEKVRENDEN